MPKPISTLIEAPSKNGVLGLKHKTVAGANPATKNFSFIQILANQIKNQKKSKDQEELPSKTVSFTASLESLMPADTDSVKPTILTLHKKSSTVKNNVIVAQTYYQLMPIEQQNIEKKDIIEKVITEKVINEKNINEKDLKEKDLKEKDLNEEDLKQQLTADVTATAQSISLIPTAPTLSTLAALVTTPVTKIPLIDPFAKINLVEFPKEAFLTSSKSYLHKDNNTNNDLVTFTKKENPNLTLSVANDTFSNAVLTTAPLLIKIENALLFPSSPFSPSSPKAQTIIKVAAPTKNLPAEIPPIVPTSIPISIPTSIPTSILINEPTSRMNGLTLINETNNSLLDLQKNKMAEQVKGEQQITPISSAASLTSSHLMVDTNNIAKTNNVMPTLLSPIGTSNWEQALGQKMSWMMIGGQQSASLSLNPPDLGPLQVIIHVNNQHADATFIAHHAEVRAALENAIPRLREMMEQSGIQLGQCNVNSQAQQQQELAQRQLNLNNKVITIHAIENTIDLTKSHHSGFIDRDLGGIDAFV